MYTHNTLYVHFIYIYIYMNCILCILYICKFSGCMLLVAQNGNSLFKCKTLLHYTQEFHHF